MKPKFTTEQEAFIKKAATPEGEPFEWTVNWPSLQKMLPQTAGRTLDFGCSGGYKLPLLPGDVREGCDNDPAALAIAQQTNPGYEYFVWDGATPCPRGPYDLIFAKMAVHLTQDYEGTVRNFAAALNPGGSVVISYPHPVRTVQYGFGSYEATHTYKVRMSYVNLDVVSVHRSVKGIIQPFLDNGFVLTALDEVYRPQHLLLKAEDTAVPNRLNVAFKKIA